LRHAGRIVAYTMTRNGPEPLGGETAPPDYAHYVEHQLKPVADAILRFLGSDFDCVTGAQRQLALF
jgi:DNA polymerase-2